MTNTNFGQILAQELALLLHPLIVAAGSDIYRSHLLETLGYQSETLTELDATVAAAIQALPPAYEEIKALIEHPPESLEQLQATLAVLGNTIDVLRQLQQLGPQLRTLNLHIPELEHLFQRLLNHLTLSYLYNNHPVVYRVLRLLTVVDDADMTGVLAVMTADGKPIFIPVAHEDVRWERIPQLLSDPVRVLGETMSGETVWPPPAGARHIADRLFPRLADLLTELGLTAVYGRRPGEFPDSGVVGNELMEGALTVVARPPLGENGPEFGATLFLSAADRGNLGLVVVPVIGGSQTLDLGGWALRLEFNIQGTIPPFAVGPQGAGFHPDAGLNRLAGSLSLFKAVEGQPIPFAIGSQRGTRLELGDFRIALPFDLSPAEQDFGLELAARRSAVVLAAAEGDGFLQAILPREGLRTDFELVAGWSRKRGLYLGGSAGLDTLLPVNKTILNTLTIDSIALGISADGEGALTAYAATTVALKLGPLTAVVERTGLGLRLTFPANGGNLGPLDLALGFKPPAGVALAIDAGQVKGGGYLFFDFERQQYAGVLQLQLGGVINVAAVGLLTTRLPDGAPGFSLFILITAQGFAPVPLGMGFTLNGIGGLLGVNRTALAEVLRGGLKQGTLDTVLFPTDPLRNAPALVSTLNAVFPAARDRFLFGPLVIIGWGTPTILSLKLAIILELPDPIRLLLLGRLSAVLPDEQHPLVRLQMDAIGEFDLRRGTVALDATLFDSRLLEFVLTGDMALRAGWGGSPHFVLAVGGFNPRFPVPAGFPRLERLAIIFADPRDLRLRLEGYLALTSNTAQFGARLELYAAAGPFSLDGFLGFDTLFQFAPLSFNADLGASIALRRNGKLLMGIALVATLSGPTPWHLHGKATFQLAFLSFTVEVDARFGRVEPPPLPQPIDVGVLLRAALADRRNWGGELPAATAPLVTLWDAATEDRLVHPLTRLTVRQRIVPLDYAIDRFGSARPSGERIFHLEVASTSGTLLDAVQPLYDDFAPGQFRDLSDDDKLRLPAFEKQIAGYTVGVDIPGCDHTQALEARIRYEGAPFSSTTSRVFLPWVRRGLPSLIAAPDTLGTNLPARLTLPLELWVNDPRRADPAHRVALSVRCYGPGDVLGIDPDQVGRIEPRRWAADFEPNYFPFVEFARADFPWLFTPASAAATGRLRPWLCLVVVRQQDTVRLGSEPHCPLPVLGCPRSELPNLEESWAWAHTQILRTGPDDSDIADILRDSPERVVSRLLCPRRLDPETRYLACLVPTFELGRKAGLGDSITPADEQALNYAWGPVSPDSDPIIRLPVYYHWEFRTGRAGDFEALVRRLEARLLPADVGAQPVDVSAPGWGMPRLPADTPGAVLSLGGALRPMTAAPMVWPDPGAPALPAGPSVPGMGQDWQPEMRLPERVTTTVEKRKGDAVRLA